VLPSSIPSSLGAGIVLDSVPESENQETISKASAPLKAIAIANTMRKLS
jgi:anthranilate synthase component 1